MGRITIVIAALAAIALTGCDDDSGDRPYLTFAGGGFVFNYNIAEAFYGFVAVPDRAIPPGTILEARFEDPAGDEPYVVTQTARDGMVQYSFRTPAVSGVEAGRDYTVELDLRTPDGALLASYTKTFRSDIGQDSLPDRPLTIGPGYHPNPDSGLPLPAK
ncbi:MAG: hypothetical protein GY791_00950 [Alphaproteobacteria bacterium]|nr:hypothetical protein [Alphaproteobacteria bacterium]